MKGALSYKERLDNGFEEAYGYYYAVDREEGDRKKKIITDYGKENRYLVLDVFGDVGSREELENLLYAKKIKKVKKVIILSGEELGDEMERQYNCFMFGWKGMEVVSMDGFKADPLVDYITERERVSRVERMKAGRERKVAAGEQPNGRSPYGYYRSKGKLYVDEYEAFVVKFIFYRREQGCSYYMIANELNQRGFRNRNDSRFWSANIQRALENKRLYQGYFTYNGVEHKGNHTPILGEEDLYGKRFVNKMMNEEEKAKLARIKDKYGRSAGKPPAVKPYFVLDEAKINEKAKRREIQR